MQRIWEHTLFVSCQCGETGSFSGPTQDDALSAAKTEGWEFVGDFNFCPKCITQAGLDKNSPMEVVIPPVSPENPVN